ncbi:transcription factor p65-like isoform X2 [Eriocheir sinensis]|uniref:Dorsal n=2 Tax=Eriocheir sinensis TaxID=95602 RepID=W5RY09_ERISI|nr:transcription factor p65-like isoform X2 [Eriocheir sinensis]XP_050704586.1 transcription factor p65-like isoform X2 [Eriocheir sinensis]XP_050704590.1 transcription factor p65-like isoform X2 [Eriocheir sinensis]XP_050704597.1 transcription factor p65-like isoform X2 [Eriocheir sinensis]AHG95994.1 dorsal [Eriocheir sinensis]
MADPMFVARRSNNQVTLNISDVIDIIGQDAPECAASDMSVYGGLQIGGDGAGAASEANFSTLTSLSRTDPDMESKRKAYVRILEQPQPKALRFRYICEGRSAGSIPGVSSTAENKTYPAIQVMGYKGPAVVVVSCVTVDPPYRPHPHNLVGKEGCKKGVCTMTINNDSMQCVFSNLGIQCVKKRDVDDALKLREEIRVDPFQTGFSHRSQTQSIDLNALRLCFQVFLEGPEKGKFTFPLKAVVSHPIYDKKATSDLIICKLSDCTSSVAGGKEIILLCDKVTKEDIQVRFYEEKDGLLEWEGYGDFQASDVHKQVAISFKTPRYKSLEVENPVKVYVQLLRPSDKSMSEPRPFQYLPLDSDPQYLKRKMAKLGNSTNTDKIGRFIAENMGGAGVYVDRTMATVNQATGAISRPIRVASRASRLSDKIKMEPPDMIGSPVSPGSQGSPAPPGVHGGHLVKPPVSPQHYTGGTMHTMPPQGPSPVGQSVYYPQSMAHGGPMGVTIGSVQATLPPRISSPHQHQYYMSPGAPSPYSPEGPLGAVAVTSGYSPVVAAQSGPAISQLLDLDSRKCIEQNSIDLDMNNINSAELRSLLPGEDFSASMVDAHLSENLSSNLNIIDPPPHINKLSSKTSLSTASSYMPNILQNKNEFQGGSDSLNNLKSEIELLNQLSSAH